MTTITIKKDNTNNQNIITSQNPKTENKGLRGCLCAFRLNFIFIKCILPLYNPLKYVFIDYINVHFMIDKR